MRGIMEGKTRALDNATQAKERLAALDRKLSAKEKIRFKRSFLCHKSRFEQMLKPLAEELNQLFNRSYAYKVEAIIGFARAIIEQQLEQDAKAIIPITEKVLKNIADHADVEVALNPADGAIINNALSEIASAHAGRRNFVIISDESIKRGSLVVKANKSIIDAHLKTQLDRALSILLL